MAVAFRSASNTGNSTSVSSRAPAVPAGAQTGDVVVVFLGRWNGAGSRPAITAPAGFTHVGTIAVSGSGGANLDVYWKRLAANDTGTYSFTWTGACWSTAQALCFSGAVATGNPVEATHTWTGNAGTFGTTTVALSGAGALAWGTYNDTGGGHTPPTGFTEVADVDCASAAYRLPGAGGSHSAASGSVASSSASAAYLLAITPASTTNTGTLAGTAPKATASFAGTASQQNTLTAATPKATGSLSATVSTSGALAGTTPAVTGWVYDVRPGPFVTAVSGTHFVDGDGQPILVRGDTIWPLPQNAGRWNGGDWQADIDAYFAARDAQGYNALYHNALGNAQSGVNRNDGGTHDGVLPFVGGEPGSFNEPYWERVDYILDRALELGFTIFMNYGYTDDWDNASLSGKTGTQCNQYGQALGNRYKDRPNLVWNVGGDYFEQDDARLLQTLNGIRTAGDTHLVSIQYYPETYSRRDLDVEAVLDWGTDNADYDFLYSYNVTYLGVEQAYSETEQRPMLWSDGSYDDDTPTDRLVFRNYIWWALTSGSRGNIYGSDKLWNWGSAALGWVEESASGYSDVDLPVIRDTFAALPGWHLILPDLDDSLVTAGRGTRAVSLASGGGGGQYTGSPQDTWVSVGVAPDGSLAVIYCPVSTTLTVDDTELVASYTATWLDPVTGAATPATVGTSYATPGTNSTGDSDWVLALQATTGTEGDLTGTAPVVTAALAATATAGQPVPEIIDAVAGAGSGTSLTVTLPAREADDFVTLVVSCNQSPTYTFTAGTAATTSLASVGGRLHAFRVDPSPGATQVTVTSSVSAVFQWWAATWRNVDPAATVDAAALAIGSSATAAIESPTVALGHIATGREVFVRAAGVNATAVWATAPNNVYASTSGNAALAVRSDEVTADAILVPAASAFNRGNDGTTRNESSLAFILQPAQTVEDTLLVNGSFESFTGGGVAVGWEAEGTAPRPATYSSTTSGVVDGATAQRMQFTGQTGDSGNIAIYQAPIDTDPGDVVRATIWLSGTLTNAYAIFGVEGFVSPGGAYIDEHDTVVSSGSLTGTPQKFEVEYTCPVNCDCVAVYFQVPALAASSVVDVRMDRATLVRVGETGSPEPATGALAGQAPHPVAALPGAASVAGQVAGSAAAPNAAVAATISAAAALTVSTVAPAVTITGAVSAVAGLAATTAGPVATLAADVSATAVLAAATPTVLAAITTGEITASGELATTTPAVGATATATVTSPGALVAGTPTPLAALTGDVRVAADLAAATPAVLAELNTGEITAAGALTASTPRPAAAVLAGARVAGLLAGSLPVPVAAIFEQPAGAAPWIRTPTRVELTLRAGSVELTQRAGTTAAEPRTPAGVDHDPRTGGVLLVERHADVVVADRHGTVDSHSEGQVALLEAHGTVLEA